uniref:transposase n=1 Tax=Sansalvadorimonas verongulae TaxID=2172824 RepID=UPI0018AD165C
MFLESVAGCFRNTQTLPGEDFLWLILQHVLPRGFQRVRNYGLLHSNAKKLIVLVQLILNVRLSITEPVVRPVFYCKHCGEAMKTIARQYLKPT